ncbi:MAG: SsrA-binding protein SmpB [Sumerlaeia bacterium]
MANAKQPPRYKELIQNRKARHTYEITDEFEAGLELRGSEVKSLRESGGSIVEAYVTNKGTQMFIVGMTIPPYSHGGLFVEPSTRDRKLLLHRREINTLIGSVSVKGMTIIPLKVYLNEKGLIKIKIGLGKGKALYDKRADIKERTVKRELEREYKIR